MGKFRSTSNHALTYKCKCVVTIWSKVCFRRFEHGYPCSFDLGQRLSRIQPRFRCAEPQLPFLAAGVSGWVQMPIIR